MNKRSLAYPYVFWAALFIVVPLLLVLFNAFVEFKDGALVFTVEYFKRFFEPIYLRVLWKSIEIAVITTAICLVLGYPVAYILSKKEYSTKGIILFLFIMPMWMNFLLRTYSWLSILETNGILNTLLEGIGLPKFKILYTKYAVILGMVYDFLPFMILPIYSCLKKMDESLVEAARDLGASSADVFKRVIIPFSIPGVLSGITMVFMPAVTTFVIPNLLGGGQFILVGNLIEQQFLTVGNWNFGSAISIIMMAVILLSMFVMNKADKNERGGLI